MARDIESVVRVVTFTLILIFRLRNSGGNSLTARKMGIFFSGCHFLRQVRQYLIKRDIKEVLEIPIELLHKLLTNHKISSSDLGNILILSHDFGVPRPGWMLVRTGDSNTHRWVNIIPLPISGMDRKCLASPQLISNLSLNNRESLNVFPEAYSHPTWASTAKIALISSHIGNLQDIESRLKNFFSSPKYVQTGDVVQIDDELSFKVQAVEGPKNSSRRSLGFLIEEKKSSLFQSTTINSSKIPIKKKLKRNLCLTVPKLLGSLEEIQDCIIDTQPAGLSDLCEQLEHLILPFISDGVGTNLSPLSFLLSGPSGSGKRTAVKVVADRLGLHLVQSSCLSLLGDSSKATELRIRGLFQSAQQVAPSILYLTDIDVIGKSREGSGPDTRILRYFASQIRQQSGIPFFVIGSCREVDKCAPDIASALLHKLSVPGLDNKQRAAALNWILEESGSNFQAPDELVRRMPGFQFGDLNAVASIAARYSSGEEITASSMEHAIEVVRKWQSRSRNAPSIPEVRWEDVGGLQHVIDELLDTIQLPLKFPQLRLSGLKRSGILLYGPPGTGKTLLAKAVATECSLHFMSVKGPELLNMYVGQSEENVRNVFRAAREASPCLIFFDELDSLAPNRGRSGDSGGVMDRVVSQLLAELDGINQSAVVFVVGATNRPDLIDPALLRPGRFDKLIFLGVNDSKEYKLSVLQALTRKFRLDPSLDLNKIVEQLPTYLTGADLYALCSNAALKSVERNILLIQQGHEVREDDAGLLMSSDFERAAAQLVPSVSERDLLSYRDLERRINQSSSLSP